MVVHLCAPLGDAVRRSLSAADGAGRRTGWVGNGRGGGLPGVVGVGSVDPCGGVEEQLLGVRAELAHVLTDALELCRVGPVLGGEFVELGEEHLLLVGGEGGIIGRFNGLADGGQGHDRWPVHDEHGRRTSGGLGEETGHVEQLGVRRHALGGSLRLLEEGGEEAERQRHEGEGRRGGEAPPQHLGHELHFGLLHLLGVEESVAKVDELAQGDADALLGEGGVDGSMELSWLVKCVGQWACTNGGIIKFEWVILRLQDTIEIGERNMFHMHFHRQ